MTTTFGACSSGPLYGSCDVHVDRRAGDLAGLERCDQRRLVHQLAARRIDDPHSVPHLRDCLGVDGIPRLVGQGQMERQEIRPCEHLVEARAVHAELAEPVGRDERVVRDDLHLEPNGTPGDLTADPPEPEHAERLVGELDPAPLRPLPPAGRQRRVGLRDVAREREQQPDRVLGGRDDVRLGRVRHDDPAPGRGVDVHVVDADAGAADDLQPRRARDHIRRDLRRGTDDQALVTVDDLLERRVRVDVDLETLTKQVDARIRDLLTDEDAHRQTLTGVSNASNARATATPRSMSAPSSVRRAPPPRARWRCRRCRTSRCARSGRSSPSGAAGLGRV